MKTAAGLCLLAAMCGHQALAQAPDGRVNDESVIVVDLSRDFDDVEVDMATADFPHMAILHVAKPAAGEPVLSWTDGGQCLDVRIVPLQTFETLRYFVEADYNWDDGTNSCIVTVTQPDGRAAKVNLYYFVGD